MSKIKLVPQGHIIIVSYICNDTKGLSTPCKGRRGIVSNVNCIIHNVESKHTNMFTVMLQLIVKLYSRLVDLIYVGTGYVSCMPLLSLSAGTLYLATQVVDTLRS